jgi:glycosyltransferase involved in cell wall biosynthesis
VKYLPQFGYQPFVFTPENPTVDTLDESLLVDVPPEAEIIKLPIWEPYGLFQFVQRFRGVKPVRSADYVAANKNSWFSKVASFIRGNFFIPDARIFWIKPSVAFLDDFLKSNQIHTIVTTGPPHSMHLIGLKLKQQNPSLKWLADFRDPWSEWDLLDTLSLTAWARKKHQRLEKKVLQAADEVITIASYHQKRLEALGGRPVHVITNGFDAEDFTSIVHQRTEKFTLRHVGVVDELRDPWPILEACRQLALEDEAFRMNVQVEFIGNVNSRFQQRVLNDEVLQGFTTFVPHVPHREVLKRYNTTDVQLLVLAHTSIAPGNLPGKFFEYLASGNFILGIGPEEGDAAQVLKTAGQGVMIDRGKESTVKEELNRLFQSWRAGKDLPSKAPDQFSRKVLTSQLVHLMNISA